MTLFNRLALDHFFISLTEKQAKHIQEHLSKMGAFYEEVKSGNESWKGHYTYSRIGEYFEIVQDSYRGSFGLAFSATQPKRISTKKIIQSKPDIEWKTGTRVTGQGENWFDWYSLDNYLSEETVFNVWVMDYYDRHVDYTLPPQKRSVLTFDSIELEVGINFLLKIKSILSLPVFHNLIMSDKEITFDIYKKDGELFNVKMLLSNTDSRFIPKRLQYSAILNNELTRNELKF